jgi:hypothetical protein
MKPYGLAGRDGDEHGRRRALYLDVRWVGAYFQRFVDMIGRERLMGSSLIRYLMKDEIEELERQHAARLEQEHLAFIGAVEDALIARFPGAPATVHEAIRGIRDPQRLRDLLDAILRAPDLESVERLLQE